MAFGRRGTTVAKAAVQLAVDGDGINEGIVDEIDKAGPGVEKAGEEHGERYGEGFESGSSSRFARVRERLSSALGDRLDKTGREAGEKVGNSFTDSVRERLQSRAESTRTALRDVFDDDFMDRLGQRLGDRIGESVGDRFELHIQEALRDVEGMFEESGKKSGDRFGRGVSRNGSLGDRLFGGRPRNNFLNVLFIGLRGVTNITETLLGSFARLTHLDSMFGSLTSKVNDLSPALGRVVTNLPMVVVGFIAVGIAATILVSVLSGLLAVLTALASTILSALIGALAVLSASLIAVGAAAALTTLAFMSMTDAQSDALSNAFRPLHQEAVGLGQIMLTSLVPAFAEWSHNLQVALALAAPLAAVMGGALANSGRILTASLFGPGVQLLMASLTKTLPTIITQLSSAVGSFINGLAGMFAALMPFVVQFSVYLNEVATRFANWATSAQGQNAIVTFVQRALTSLASLWNFLRAVGSLIASVFFDKGVQQTGDNIFDRMARAVRKFTDYLAEDDRLNRWMAEGLAFAIALGEAIHTVGELLEDLNSSGVIAGLSNLVQAGALAYKYFGGLASVLPKIINMIGTVEAIQTNSANDLEDLATLMNPGNTLQLDEPSFDFEMPDLQAIMDSLQLAGLEALNQTSVDSGGYLKDPKKKKFKNPFIDLAESLIEDAPSAKALMRKAMKVLNKALRESVMDAAAAQSADLVKSSFGAQIDSLRAQGNSLVESAQSALSSAAERLLNAGSMKEARKALKEVKAMQKALAAAQAQQERLNKAAAILANQKTVNNANVEALLAGQKVNATLAEYAAAREEVTKRLEAANQALADAVSLRDNYTTQVADAARSFASIISAQAKTINGVQQALTAGDITENLKARLEKIKEFHRGLRVLLSRGLSDAAYKQLLDAGVEQGGAYVQALLEGGQGAVQQTNSLVAQIDDVAQQLGEQASNRLYQAGVDAAQGLVDGLTSLSAELDAAAAALGKAIADAVKRELGILDDPKAGHGGGSASDYDGSNLGMHEFVNDGKGRCKKCGKVRNTSKHTNRGEGHHSQRATPQTPVGSRSYAPSVGSGSGSGSSADMAGDEVVSGNSWFDRRFRDLIIQTPTKDPKAVGLEVLNEVVGRL